MVAKIGRVKLTAGNLRNFHIYLRTVAHLIPDDGIGGSSALEKGEPFGVVFQPGSSVETDVAGDKMILRDRKAVRAFFEATAADVGDVVVIERTGARSLTIWLDHDGDAVADTDTLTSAISRKDVPRQLARADDWIRTTFAALEVLAQAHAVDHWDETGPGRRYRFARGGHVRVHPRLSDRIVVGFPNSMRQALEDRGLLIDRADAAWMNFDRGMSLDIVGALIEQAAR